MLVVLRAEDVYIELLRDDASRVAPGVKGTAILGIQDREFTGRQPAESLLRSFLVVFPTPHFDDDLRVRLACEPVLIQAFVAQAAF